jgi:hypothetical protein
VDYSFFCLNVLKNIRQMKAMLKKLLLAAILIACRIMLFAQDQPAWVSVYNGPTDGNDVATAMAVDDAGFVYVSGTDFSTIKYSPSGTQRWVQQYAGGYATCMAIDQSANIYVAGAFKTDTSGYDYAAIKFDSAGNRKWVSTYAGSNGSDQVNGIAVDKQGNVYITGASAGASDMWCDYITVKISPSGGILWTQRFGGSYMTNERATAITVSDSGFVYVTGYFDKFYNHGRYDFGTIKYTPEGDTVWTRFYNGTGNDDDIPHAIAVDHEGNVYITGQSWGNWYDDYATLKYNAAGTLLWAACYNGPVNSFDKAYSLKLDASGNVYITGASGGLGINYDYATIKYSNSGVQQWVARYNGPDNQDDYATALTIDNKGNILVTGYSDNAPSPNIKLSDYATVKYNSAGIEQWSGRYNGPGKYKDRANAIAADKTGNFYVTGSAGYYVEQGNFADYATLRYNAGTNNPVLTDSVTKITFSSALVYASISNTGWPVLGRGVVYSQTVVVPTLGSGTVVEAGSGEGDFSVPINNLSANKPYFVRAYAVGENDTVYGGVVSFKTLPMVIAALTEGFGNISNLSGVVNRNGALVWNGSSWILNNTWSHRYFNNVSTNTRLKPVEIINVASFEKDTAFMIQNYLIDELVYQYSYPAKNGGNYWYVAIGYMITDTISKKNIVLRSRGTGTGLTNSYFDIYIENETSSGVPPQITAIRSDPRWYTYSGMTIEDVLTQTSPTDSLTGKFSSTGGWYFMDIGGGGDMGPAGVGKSFIFHTASFSLADVNTADHDSTYASDFAVRWMDAKGTVREMEFVPGLLSETFVTGVQASDPLIHGQMSISPNPVTTTATISYTLTTGCPVSVRLFSYAGKEIKRLNIAASKAGIQSATVDMSDLPAGIYLCRISTRSSETTGKIIKAQ